VLWDHKLAKLSRCSVSTSLRNKLRVWSREQQGTKTRASRTAAEMRRRTTGRRRYLSTARATSTHCLIRCLDRSSSGIAPQSSPFQRTRSTAAVKTSSELVAWPANSFKCRV
jgi:hypothetical protein